MLKNSAKKIDSWFESFAFYAFLGVMILALLLVIGYLITSYF